MPELVKDKLILTICLIIGLFLLLPWLAFWEITFAGQTVWWSDLSWMHYPRHIFAAEEWLAGRIPLWDPYQHNGLPFLAETQVGALYPFSVIFFSSLSPSLELSIYILLHFSLAAIFTFMLAQLVGLGLAPATAAGLSFGFGGFLMAQVTNLNIMTGAVWLPLILYGVIQVDRQRTWLAALLAGIPPAMQIYTSQPQIVFYTLVTVGGYAVYRITADFFATENTTHHNAKYAARTLLLIGVAICSGLLLAAPQWLPTLELQQLSTRSEARGFSFLTENSLPPAMWLNLLLPSLFGNNVTGFRGGDPFQEDFLYTGFIPLVLIFFSPFQRHKRDMPYFVLLLLGSALLAMGKYTPLYEYIVQYLPGFALFRIPARWLMVVNLALAMLTAFGLEAILKRGLSGKQLIAVAAAGGIALAAVTAAWLHQENLSGWANNWSSLNKKLLAAFYEHGYTINPIYQNRMLLGDALLWLTTPVFLLIGNIAATLLLFSAFAAKKIGKTTFSVILIALLSIDLAAAGGTTINPIRPDSWWQQLSGSGRYVVNNIGDARVFPLGMGSEEKTVSHLGQYFPSVYRVRSAGGHGSSLLPARTDIFLDEAHPVQVIQVMGVRYLLTAGQMGADVASTFPLAYSDASGYVYENPNPLPRAFMVHHAITANSPEAALAYFKSTGVNPAQTVVIETNRAIPQPGKTDTPGTAKIINEHAQRIELTIDTPAAGYLVLLDTYYPGWQAAVDNQLATVHRANYIARAVFVPAGQHTVTFYYWPRPFYVGLWLAGATIAAIVAGVIFRHQKKN